MSDKIRVQRIQTGLRIEKRLLKVMKGLAEYLDLSLGDLTEGVMLHVFEGKAPFSEKTINKIKELKKVYDLNLDASHSHDLIDQD